MGPKPVPDDPLLLGDTQAEIRLDVLLDEMLDSRGPAARPDGIEGPAPIAELRDTARRLRAASQWLPLPESRLAVRRALLVASQRASGLPGAGRAAWRRAGMWLSAAAMIAIVGAWSLGARTLDAQGPASIPAHALRALLGKARVAWFPGPAQYALTYEFPAVRSPDAGATTRIHGTLGGLPVILSLTAGADACSSGVGCGTFTMALAQLSTPAGARFGTLRGTFGCGADGACTLAFAEMTGVFAAIAEPTLSVSATGQRAGRLTTKMASLNDWVSTVTSAGQMLQAERLLPAGLTVKDLATAAGTNGTGSHTNGNRSDGSGRHDVQNRTGSPDRGAGRTNASGSPAPPAVGAGVGSTPHGGAGQPGSASSTTPAGPGSVGRGGSHSASAGQDHLPNSQISGGRALGKNRGASSGIGGTGPRTGGSGTSGGQGGTPHNEHGPNGQTEAGHQHDEEGPNSNHGRGHRGDDGSGDGGGLNGGGHTGIGGQGSTGGGASKGGDVDRGGTGGGNGGGGGGNGGGGDGGGHGRTGGGKGGDVDRGGTGAGNSGGGGGGNGGGSGGGDGGGHGTGGGKGDVDKGGTGGGDGGGSGGGNGGGKGGGNDDGKGGGDGGGSGGGRGGGASSR